MHEAGLSILIVEDDSSIQRLMQRIITPYALRVTLAVDGNEAIEHLAREQFDLVLLDIMLPKKNGFDVADQIARMPTKPRIIVVSAISRYFGERFPPGTLILQKPLDFAELDAAVKAYAEERERHGRR